MGLITVYVSPLPNLPKEALIIPCYHCQLNHFQRPVKYRPLHNLLLAPNSPYLPLHFKLEELHFFFTQLLKQVLQFLVVVIPERHHKQIFSRLR